MRRKQKTFTISPDDLADFPEKLREAVSGLPQLKYTLHASERKVLYTPSVIPTARWSEKNRVLVKSVFPGAWKNEISPFLVGIMNTADEPYVETVILCKAPQIGGSEVMHNFAGRCIDVEPGDMLYVFPDDKLARENSKDRILPMITASPNLRRYRTGRDEDESGSRINLRHMTIYTASAQSASQLSNKPCRYVFFDEVDKYPDTAGKRETDPISLGRKRATTYGYGRKIWLLSTPTIEQGAIWQAYQNEAQVRFVYLAKCPNCGELQLMHTKQVHWDGGSEADPATIETTQGGAWYECAKCREKWDDITRLDAVAAGGWFAEDSGKPLETMLSELRPKRVGFHLPALLSRFVSLGEYAAAFLHSLRDKTKMKDFCNGFEAVPWQDYGISREEDAILALRDERKIGQIPQTADLLVAGIDTQDNGFWYEIRAVRCGGDLESWGVCEGFVSDFDGLKKVLFRNEYKKSDGTILPVWKGMIDSQGHRTAEVYAWCKQHPLILPIKGEQVIKGSPVPPPTIIEHYPGTRRPIPGGLSLYRLDTNYFKDALVGKLAIPSDEPGAWHLHSEYPISHARHLTSEYIDDKTGKWACPNHKPNHLWDCSVYILALCWFFGLGREIRRGNAETVRKTQGKAANPYTQGRNIFN